MKINKGSKVRIHYLFVIAIKKKKRIIPDKPNQTLRNKKSEVSSSWTMERILRNIPALRRLMALLIRKTRKKIINKTSYFLSNSLNKSLDQK